MCSRVIAEGDGQCLRGKVCISRALLLGVIVPDGDDHRRMRRMHLRAMEQVTAQIDHFHIGLLTGFWLLRFLLWQTCCDGRTSSARNMLFGVRAEPNATPKIRRVTPSGVRPNMTATMINP